MADADLSPAALTKEKRLWEIYLLSRRIKTTPFNFISTWIVFFVLGLQVMLGQQSVDQTLDLVRKFSEIGLQVSITVLGFLIAGFTIFATISQPKLLIKMSQARHQDTGLSWLKYNFFIFMRVFVYYIAYSVACCLIIMLGQKGGLLSVLASISPNAPSVKFTLVNSAYIFIFTGLYFLVLQLKSFTFNVYHSVMTSLRWQAEEADNSND